MPLYVADKRITKLLEGFRQYKYVDTQGNETIGYGFNLTHGFTEDECDLILSHRLNTIETQLIAHRWFRFLSITRQQVIIDMAYNLGVGGLMSFKKMIAALEAKDYVLASQEMERSIWFKEAGENRTLNLQYMMLHNKPSETFAKELQNGKEKAKAD